MLAFESSARIFATGVFFTAQSAPIYIVVVSSVQRRENIVAKRVTLSREAVKTLLRPEKTPLRPGKTLVRRESIVVTGVFFTAQNAPIYIVVVSSVQRRENIVAKRVTLSREAEKTPLRRESFFVTDVFFTAQNAPINIVVVSSVQRRENIVAKRVTLSREAVKTPLRPEKTQLRPGKTPLRRVTFCIINVKIF